MIGVDSNMNTEDKTSYQVNGNLNQRDVENGKTTSSTTSNSLWRSVRRVLLRAAVMIFVLAALAGVFALLWIYLGWISVIQLVVVALIVYVIASGGWRWIYVAIRTAPRDLRALSCYIRLLWMVRRYTKKNYTLPDIFHQMVLKHPDKPCFLFKDQVWSFSQVEEYSLKVTSALRNQGFGKGNVIGLLISNCPQLPAIWLGCARLGIVCPLVNTNQKGRALLHSIHIANCDALIFGLEYASVVSDIATEIKSSIKLYSWSPRELGKSQSTVQVATDIGTDLTVLLDVSAPAIHGPSDGDGFLGKLLYIYTSGTTGMPKAAVNSNSRYVFMVAGMHFLGSFKSSDVVYSPLPLYHTAGGIMAVGQALLFGCTVVLKEKFSASAFIPDCKKYNATIAHYIGEMCRYVLATPPSPSDTDHQIRVIYGNGLRPQIWSEFISRFNIPRVAEFYGATEGNANIVNIDSRVGAIGFVSRIIPWVYPIAIIKVDPNTGDPIRNSKGLCQLCKPNEPGVFIGKIQANNPSRAFLGYVNQAESDKKVVKDVFNHGDSAFISGDLLIADEFGYLFFKDRTGDTFRWRGENVSTSEVEAAVSRVANHRDAVVYGVQIPGVEGRAGMCGLVDIDDSLNLKDLVKGLSRDLPTYAQPIFLRILTSVDMTGTFKMKKLDLQEQGFDPNIIKDKLYYFDKSSNGYVTLTQDIHKQIISGQIRL